MKILLLGKNGQVGWELQRALQPLGEVIALDRQTNPEGWCGDVANFAEISKAFEQIRPDIVVNASAYTAVDKAESDAEQAHLINALAIKHLAEECQKHSALLIHYSTDYVFDGTGVLAWKEDDQTAPVNLYGQTKRDGELALEQSGVSFLNFRTCWVYAARGNNFIKTMLKLAQMKEELNIIQDQVGVPTGGVLRVTDNVPLLSLTVTENAVHSTVPVFGSPIWMSSKFRSSQHVLPSTSSMNSYRSVMFEYPTPTSEDVTSRFLIGFPNSSLSD